MYAESMTRPQVPNLRGKDGLRWCPVALTAGYHHVRPLTGAGDAVDNSK